MCVSVTNTLIVRAVDEERAEGGTHTFTTVFVCVRVAIIEAQIGRLSPSTQLSTLLHPRDRSITHSQPCGAWRRVEIKTCWCGEERAEAARRGANATPSSSSFARQPHTHALTHGVATSPHPHGPTPFANTRPQRRVLMAMETSPA
jgi:hypothetical protein